MNARAAKPILFCATSLLAACTVGNAPPVDAGAEDAGTTVTSETCREETMGATLSASCADEADCQDGCFCNGRERCVDGACAAGTEPCADAVACTIDACVEAADQCVHDPDHASCGDSNACTGVERCHPTVGCQPALPLYCNDEDPCTLDACDPALGCAFVPLDLDADGFVAARCGGDDCDDRIAVGDSVHPGAIEDCTNRRDDDCDDRIDFADTECVADNDTCDSAFVLSGPGTYSWDFDGLTSDYSLGCRLTPGADVVFRFELPPDSDAFVTVHGDDAALALRRPDECETGPDLTCVSAQTRSPTLVARGLPAGPYDLIVQSGAVRPFDLELRFAASGEEPAGDQCDSAVDITSSPALVEETLLLEDARNSCASATLPTWTDAFFFFDLPDTTDVSVEVEHLGGAQLAVAVGTECGVYDAELACWTGRGMVQRNFLGLPAGHYVVSVATDGRGGAIRAALSTPAPP